jgi:protein-tyrosine phosphatase
VTKILIVCLGNICRSPMAQRVLQHMALACGAGGAISVDSAGTGANTGEHADPRTEATLARRGYLPGKLRARRVVAADFERFDLILAMDAHNLTQLRKACPPQHVAKLRLFLDATEGHSGQDVPDPYYGNAQGFDKTLELCELGARSWLKRLCN